MPIEPKLLFHNINFNSLFALDIPAIEVIIRGSVVYLALFCLLRLILKRQTGTLGITDMLVIVLIADASQNAMAGDYHSIPAGILLVATIIFWSYTLDWLGYKIPFIQRFIHPAPLMLIKDGKLLVDNMRRELVTRGELLSQLREQGVISVNEVKEACMEGDGKISVITHENYHAKKQGKEKFSI